MRFSLKSFLMVVLLINLLAGITFGLPTYVSFSLLTFVSLVVFPPIIIVGVVNTSGYRRAFFLGAMVAGMMHYLVSFYYGYTLVLGGIQGDISDIDFEGDDVRFLVFMHPIGYLIGVIGGLSGMFAYWSLMRDGGERSTGSESESNEEA